jgi:hypothetical protein
VNGRERQYENPKETGDVEKIEKFKNRKIERKEIREREE